MKMLRMAGFLTGIVLGLASMPASADVVLTFTQTDGTPPGGLAVGGSLTVTDEAYAQGLNLTYSLDAAGTVTAGSTGLLDASFFFSTPGISAINLTLADLLSGSLGLPAGTVVTGQLTSAAGGGGISGFLNAAGDGFGFTSSTDGGVFSSRFIAGAGPCIGRGCGAVGNLTTVTTVPEPSTLSLVAIGGLAMVAGLRRRKPALAPAA